MSEITEAADEAASLVETRDEDPRLAVAEAVSKHDVPEPDREAVLDEVLDRTDATVDGRQESTGDDSDGPDIDGQLLDDLQNLLTKHQGPDNAITSAEIAATLGIEDSGSYPRTREAVKVLLQERQVPVIANSNGYFIATQESQIETELESLQSRIQGIQQRQQLIREAWESHQEVRSS